MHNEVTEQRLSVLLAIQLLRRAATIFPWPLRPQNSTMYGLLFLGSFAYFLYGFLRPSWHNARGQLLAFLVYDLVLIPPYAKHFEVDPIGWTILGSR